jgi:hypothetical protein
LVWVCSRRTHSVCPRAEVGVTAQHSRTPTPPTDQGEQGRDDDRGAGEEGARGVSFKHTTSPHLTSHANTTSLTTTQPHLTSHANTTCLTTTQPHLTSHANTTCFTTTQPHLTSHANQSQTYPHISRGISTHPCPPTPLASLRPFSHRVALVPWVCSGLKTGNSGGDGSTRFLRWACASRFTQPHSIEHSI